LFDVFLLDIDVAIYVDDVGVASSLKDLILHAVLSHKKPLETKEGEKE